MIMKLSRTLLNVLFNFIIIHRVDKNIGFDFEVRKLNENFIDKLSINPIIAAIHNEKELKKALKSPCEVIFLLNSTIINIQDIVQKVKTSNKIIYIHTDLIQGLSKDNTALEYIVKNIQPDGIITTKNNLIKYANELGLFTIQRLFIIDSLSLETGIQSIKKNKPNAIEIMPGIMPTVIDNILKKINIPIITGGLISTKEHVINSLKAGAIGVSTSNEAVWYM